MPDWRITVLVENTAGRRGLLGEHGLAMWIELPDGKVLFDTGQGHVLGANARRLGIRTEQAKDIILSHGHYDHTGGLGEILESARRPRIYAHRAAFEPKFARNDDGTGRDVGMDAAITRKIRKRSEFIPVEGPTEICEALHLTGPVPRLNDYEDTGGDFFADAQCTLPDELIDDQAAFFETPAGTVVILGCTHSGIVNTLRYIRQLTNNRPIHTVIGGMHLINADARRMDETITELRRLDVRRLLPCHCTGLSAIARMWNDLPGRCYPCHVGTTIGPEV